MQALIPPTKRKLITLASPSTTISSCARCLHLHRHARRSGTLLPPAPAFQREQTHRSRSGSAFHTSPTHLSPNAPAQPEHEQVLPLGSYYESLLSSPSPSSSRSSSNTLPTFVPTGDLTKQQRAALLFGSIEGSGYVSSASSSSGPASTTSPGSSSTTGWRTINGIPIPPRPTEPDNCCMSGCVHCVWDDYRDDVEGWAGRVREAQAQAHAQAHQDTHEETANAAAQKAKTRYRAEVEESSGSMDDDGGGSEGLWDVPSKVPGGNKDVEAVDELFQGIPVGIREFMATEKKIRERKKARRRQES